MEFLRCLFLLPGLCLSLLWFSGCANTGPAAAETPGDRAQAAIRAGNYLQAEAIYSVERENGIDCGESLARTYCSHAASLLLQHNRKAPTLADCKEAIRLCELAKKTDFSVAQRSDKLIRDAKHRIEAISFQKAVRDASGLDLAERKKTIDRLLTQGAIQQKNQLYMPARETYEQILAIDPYQVEATTQLTKLYIRLERAASLRAAAQYAETRASDAWQGIVQVTPVREEKTPFSQGQEDAKRTITELYLRDTIIPKINMEGVSLKNVFQNLSKLAEEAGGHPLSFVYVKFSPDAPEFPPIEFKADKISIEDALGSVCDAMMLDFYEVDPYTFEITRRPAKQ